jgi:hypothetical protein
MPHNVDRRRALLTVLLLGVLVALGMPAAASSKNIVGTTRSDVLRGTSGPDVINGQAGNDTIYGLAGNDRLLGGPGNDTIYGGPGADHINCGPGKDTVHADPSDTVAKDCEIVKGLAPKTPPPPPLATPGHYLGTTSQGHRIGFDVGADGTTISTLTVRGDAQCQSGMSYKNVGVTVGSPLPISGGAFTSDNPTTLAAILGDFTSPVPFNAKILGGSVIGTFNTAHQAGGTFQLNFNPIFPDTTCSTGPISWTAQPSPQLVPPGHYTGISGFVFAGAVGIPDTVKFDVADDGLSITNLHIDYMAPCDSSHTWRSSIDWSGPFLVHDDRSLTAEGTSPDGTTIALTMSFDAAGSLTGTTDIHVSPDYQGVHYECDTGKVTWQGGLQS